MWWAIACAFYVHYGRINLQWEQLRLPLRCPVESTPSSGPSCSRENDMKHRLVGEID